MFIEVIVHNSYNLINVNHIIRIYPIRYQYDGPEHCEIWTVDGKHNEYHHTYEEVKTKIAEAIKGGVPSNEVYRF